MYGHGLVWNRDLPGVAGDLKLAFDLGGSLVASQVIMTPSAQFALVSLAASEIHRVTFQTSPDGGLFDNFTFGSISAVPGPATNWLLLGGFTLFVFLRYARGRRS